MKVFQVRRISSRKRTDLQDRDMTFRRLSKPQTIWLTGAFLPLAAMVAALNIEPMRFRLPYRYLIQDFDIHREGFIDFATCMRVRLTPEEAETFVSKSFSPSSRAAKPILNMKHTRCDAPFWPERFQTRTLAYEIETTPPPFSYLKGSSGAACEDGYLYFWSNSM
ncbi:MAG TPA: hypothetical protein ENH55_09705 [Aurantimonas coralicida]|nr:hypothetical protein [Aurantimonas coralicida]